MSTYFIAGPHFLRTLQRLARYRYVAPRGRFQLGTIRPVVAECT